MILDLFREFLLLFLYGFSTLAGIFIPMDSVRKNPTQKRPIVMVHGWLGKPPIYFWFKRYLERQGFAVYMTNFGLLLGDITGSAQNLEKFIAEKKLNHVVLVGESCGGLVCYIYTQQFHGWDHVDELVSIAAPFGGSWMALLSFFSLSARQMLPNSSFIKAVRQEKPLHPEHTHCISARFDEVLSTGHDTIPGAHAITVPDIGHVRTQAFSREVYHRISEIAATTD